MLDKINDNLEESRKFIESVLNQEVLITKDFILDLMNEVVLRLTESDIAYDKVSISLENDTG